MPAAGPTTDAAQRDRPPHVRELQAPALALRALTARDPRRYPVLLDSISGGSLARSTILPRVTGDALWLDAKGQLCATGSARPFVRAATGFLEALDAWWRSEASEYPAVESGAAPWHGGFVVFLGYELAGEVEPRLAAVLPPAPAAIGAFALRAQAALVFDHVESRMLAAAEAGCEAGLDAIAKDLLQVRHASADPGTSGLRPALLSGPLVEDDPQEFIDGVIAAQRHIAQGDVYQVNLSRGWKTTVATDRTGVVRIYQALCSSNPAPFAVLASWGGLDLLSSSPERLLRIARGIVSSRPIAGTRPRERYAAIATADAERVAAANLIANPKERAEHVMLIDLERNDLGRVCEAGTVCVTEFMTVESYAHVHHIVSNVEGRLRPGTTPVQALRAVFPGGTITGCPKIRSMEIIAGLERCGRGPYTGSIGVLGLDGSADFNILIRTISISGDQLSVRAGAGIVADSDPVRELEETRAKARGVLAALA